MSDPQAGNIMSAVIDAAEKMIVSADAAGSPYLISAQSVDDLRAAVHQYVSWRTKMRAIRGIKDGGPR